MIGFKSKKDKYSVSGWENSYFGGYSRMINDYPELKSSPSVILTPSPKFKLGPYSSGKLMKMFIQLVNKRKDFGRLFYNCAKVTEGEKEYIIIGQYAKADCLNEIKSSSEELASLFENYSEELIDSIIKIDVTPKDKEQEKPKDKQKQQCSSEGSGLGSSEKGDESEDEGSGDEEEFDANKAGREIERQEKEAQIQAAQGAMEEIEEYKSYYTDGWMTSYTIKEPVFKQVPKKRGIYYDPEDIVLANKIVNKLDISFDSDSDKLNSLKQGKLDTGKLAEFIGGNDHIYYRIEENMITKPFAVTILCDESGSMDGDEIHAQYRLVKILYKVFNEILPPDKLSIYGHTTASMTTSNHDPYIRIYQDPYNDTFEERINEMLGNHLQGNYDLQVIKKLYETIRSRTSDCMLLIVISDGKPGGGDNIIEDLQKYIEKTRRDNFVTIGLGLGWGGGYVRDIYNYSYIIDNYDTMVERISMLLNKVVKTEFQ